VSKQTQSSRGKSCKLRIYPYCQDNTETVVACHIASTDKGMGIKSPDIWSVDGCDVCHSIIDGRMRVDLSPLEIERCINRALYLTIKRKIEEGLIVEL